MRSGTLRRLFLAACLMSMSAVGTPSLGSDGVGPEGPVNRLAQETSPYLLLHAHNPVDWYPWGPEALEKARREHKPIFLSIGYSTCFWCHVMEREVFTDPAIAALMNRWFINIKVDREERPDLDEIYMTATQLLTGRGGWPNSLFLTPSLRPFFAGTYFPPEDSPGRVGFPTVLTRLHEAWEARSADVEKMLYDNAQLGELLVEVGSQRHLPELVRAGQGRRPARRAKLPAFLDDYAFLVRDLLALDEASDDPRWLNAAARLSDEMENRLGIEKGGHHVSVRSQDLLFQARTALDSAIPAANGVVILNLLRLAERTLETGISAAQPGRLRRCR